MALFDKVAPCPYCYVDIDLRRVRFRCLGRPAPGREACKREADPIRVEQFKDSEPYYPAFAAESSLVRDAREANCPDCFGRTGVRLCPTCHSKLPDGFAGDSPLFGLVGARSAGKTVMLAVLMRELGLSGPVARRFNHIITVYGGGDTNGQAHQLQMMLNEMEGTAELPAQTQQAAGHKVTPAVFEWKAPLSGLSKMMVNADNKSTVFSFYDTAGEDLATQDRAESMHYLLATDGIILLLDPFAFPGNAARGRLAAEQRVETSPENVLGAVINVLRLNERTKRNRKIKQPIAVVVSKIDAFYDQIPPNDPVRQPSSKLPFFDESESLSVHDHMAGLVAHWGGDGLLRMLDANFTNYRLFGLSALGAEPDYAHAKIDQRGLLPHRVAEPLLWLMSRRGFIPTQQG